MAKENLVKKLGKKVLPYLLVSALAFGSYRCADNFVDPNSEEPVAIKPVAMLIANPTEGYAPLEVSFDGSMSYARKGYLKEYHWDFDGDGNTDSTTSGAYENYIYENTGEYNAGLIVVDSQGQPSNKALERIVVKFVDSKKPVAMFIANPTEGDAPLFVEFDGSLSYARTPKSYLEKYLWDFDGDGDTDSTTSGTSGAWVDHVYEEGGEYDASLVVVDNQGQESDKVLEKIVVNEDIVSLGQIAFWSNRDVPGEGYNEDIYSGDIVVRVRDDNIELRNIERLTTDPRQDLHPAWSPDGKYLAWITNRGDPGFNSIYVMEENGTNKRKLTSPINTDFLSPSWSPDGTQIGFSYIDRDLGTNGIGKINIDGSELTKLIENQGVGTVPSGVFWFNDGRIFYHDYMGGNWDLYTVNSDGSGLPERITNTPYNESLPSVSPIGDRLTFVSDQFGNLDIFSANLDGTSVERITTDSGVEVDPRFSLDGTQIIFAYDAPLLFNPQLYLVNSDGTGDWTQLTTEGANRYPAWKPEIEDLNFN